MFSLRSFLFVSRITQKLMNRFFTKFGEKVAHGPRKKPLDFGSNPDLDPDQESSTEFFYHFVPQPYSGRLVYV